MTTFSLDTEQRVKLGAWCTEQNALAVAEQKITRLHMYHMMS